MIQLSPPQLRRLTLHAAARNLTPEEALQVLLDTPLPAPLRARRPWTAEELQMLANPRNSPRDLAVRTGRTRAAISNKRHKMKVSPPDAGT